MEREEKDTSFFLFFSLLFLCMYGNNGEQSKRYCRYIQYVENRAVFRIYEFDAIENFMSHTSYEPGKVSGQVGQGCLRPSSALLAVAAQMLLPTNDVGTGHKDVVCYCTSSLLHPCIFCHRFTRYLT